MPVPEAVLGLALGYLLGSFPSAALVARLNRRDIFALGSSNMGAMNTARNLGFGWGALVLLLDLGKGALAVGLALWLVPGTLLGALAASVGCVLGHAWPLYTRFRGGKALACALGASLPLYPLAGLAGLALIALLTLALRRRPVRAAVATVTLYPGLVWLVTSLQGNPNAPAYFVTVLAMSFIALVKHLPALRLEQAGAGH